MRWSVRDAVASVLVVAMLTGYIGYLVGGSMPLIHDTLATAATTFILWIAVFLVLLVTDGHDLTTAGGTAELMLFALSITLAGAAVLAADLLTGVAPVLLAVSIATAVVTWTVRLLHDSGRLRHGPGAPRGPRHGRLAAR